MRRHCLNRDHDCHKSDASREDLRGPAGVLLRPGAVAKAVYAIAAPNPLKVEMICYRRIVGCRSRQISVADAARNTKQATSISSGRQP